MGAVGSAVNGAADRHRTQALAQSAFWEVTGEVLALPIVSDIPFTFLEHGINSGSHGESYSKHTGASGDR